MICKHGDHFLNHVNRNITNKILPTHLNKSFYHSTSIFDDLQVKQQLMMPFN